MLIFFVWFLRFVNLLIKTKLSIKSEIKQTISRCILFYLTKLSITLIQKKTVTKNAQCMYTVVFSSYKSSIELLLVLTSTIAKHILLINLNNSFPKQRNQNCLRLVYNRAQFEHRKSFGVTLSLRYFAHYGNLMGFTNSSRR